MEAYLVDDTKQIVTNPKGQQFTDTYVVFDLETTGFSAEADRIIEIGAVKSRTENRGQVQHFCQSADTDFIQN